MSIAPLVVNKTAELLTMAMADNDRPELSEDEKQEKIRLRDLIARHRPEWERLNPREGKLTQGKLGQLVGELRGEEPLTQGGIWHYITPESNTRLNPDVVQAMAFIVGFDVADVSPRFAPKPYATPVDSEIDATIMAQIRRLPLSSKQQFLVMISAMADSIESSPRDR
jgi:hypothetical protein